MNHRARILAVLLSLSAFPACQSSGASSTDCASLDACCAKLGGADALACIDIAASGDESTCQTQLTAYQASNSCEGSFQFDPGDSGTTRAGTSCTSLGSCCASMTSPDACNEVVAGGVESVCASTLSSDVSSGLCNGSTNTSSGACVDACNTGESCVNGACMCDTSCTGSYTCNAEGRCVGGACVAGGGACTTFSDCCSGSCAEEICTACIDTGDSCTRADECCSNICEEGLCQACGAAGSTCTTDGQCCAGSTCSNGACVLPAGSVCTSDDECSSGLPCTELPDNAYECCNVLGQGCTADTDCCPAATVTLGTTTATCSNGTCVGGVGARCSASSGCTTGITCDSEGACGQASQTACSEPTECALGACNGGLCCSKEYGYCFKDADCCEGEYCGGSGGTSCTQCLPSGTMGCGTDAECCSGSCQDGTCVAMSSGTCAAVFDSCSGSGQGTCCSGLTCADGMCA